MQYDLIVIGSGPGGYVAAIRAAKLGLKTACVDKGPLGGTCLNVGCIPSKSLLQSSELYASIQNDAKAHGIEVGSTKIHLDTMMKRKEGIIKDFNVGIAGLFKANKIDHIDGYATFIDPHTIEVAGKKLTARNFIIATGSEPTKLPFLPFDEKKIVSSTGALSLKKIPKKLIVIGAGVIGLELGSVYSRLGSEVHVIEFLDHICPTLDRALSKAFHKELQNQGLNFHLSTKVESAQIKDQVTLTLNKGESLTADVVLVAIGRRPYTESLGLDKLDITPDSFIPINNRFQTKHPHIYAIGDVTGQPMLAHKASEEGTCAAEIIAGLSPTLQYLCIPNVVYTHPEVASVGLTSEQVKELGLETKTNTTPFKSNSRAKCAGQDHGLVKLIICAKTHKLLGAHILGSHAGELIQECVLAMEQKLPISAIANASHAHPTFVEAIKDAAKSLIP